MVLYGYIIQAFRLPCMIQHSPSLLADDLNNYGRPTRQEYNTGDSDEMHYYYGYNIPRQLIYSGPRIFNPGLGGFFYRPGYGSASSHGNG